MYFNNFREIDFLFLFSFILFFVYFMCLCFFLLYFNLACPRRQDSSREAARLREINVPRRWISIRDLNSLA